jgi:hypothetical protein
MKFIDYKEAMGILAAEGFTVSVHKKDNSNYCIANGETVTVPMFRDGATWKVKEEALQDWIDENKKEGKPEARMSEKILEALMKQRFTNFYTGDFEAYLCGDEDCPTKEEILEKISQLFRF